MNQPLLEIRNLSVSFQQRKDLPPARAIRHISFQLEQNETLGIIGESGSGKSITLLSLMGLVDDEPGIVSGTIKLTLKQITLNLLEDIEQYIIANGSDIRQANASTWKKLREQRYKNIRGKHISMIFQNPKLAFNPYCSIGKQISEMIRLHTDIKDKKQAKQIAIQWLQRVKMDAPEIRYNNNPYGLSGGMCQRAMLAMALASQPAILVADEPTTGLDATIQSNILDLLAKLKYETGTSMIVVSHDFNVIQRLANRVLVYFDGQIVEQGKTEAIFDLSRKNIHPYTKQLLRANLHSKTTATISIKNVRHACGFSHLCSSKETEFAKRCENEAPKLFNLGNQHHIRCWKYKHA
ncbi:MAG TPA: ABC transporter ATP-binding protein [Gammaproteobacteria bacterium]|nr:ABC transporter ATP-binding protein [Gammaproteobacteria bacterium]